MLFTVCLYFSFSGNAQDIYSMNLMGGGGEPVPKKILVDGNYRYIFYEKTHGDSWVNQQDICIAKIDASGNQVVNDFYFRPIGQGYYNAIDIEISGNNLYVLITNNIDDTYLMTVNKTTGAVIRKEKLEGSLFTNNTSTEFIPTDLSIENVNNSPDPYISILGVKFSNYLYSRIGFMYKRLSEPTFNAFEFDGPGGTHSFIDLKIDYSPYNATNPYAQISGKDITGNGAFSFAFYFPTNSIFASTHYNINNQAFRFMDYVMWDGILFFYGQLQPNSTQEYIPGQSGDVFIIPANGLNQVFTFNNPYFLALSGENHSGEIINGGMGAFGGLYVDPADINHARYAAGKVDVASYIVSNFSMPPFTAYSYVLRSYAGRFYDAARGVYNVGTHNESYERLSVTSNRSSGEVEGIFYREPDYSYVNPLYYLKQLTGTTCNTPINFTQTYDKTITIEPYPLSIYATHTITSTDYDCLYVGVGTGPISSLCIERLTNSVPPPPPPVPCDNPNYPCWEGLLPWNQSVKKGNNRATNEESISFDVKISPNPIINEIIVTSEKAIRAVLVYDASGKAIANTNNLNQKQVTIKVENIKPGTYFAKVTKADGTVATKKLIKL